MPLDIIGRNMHRSKKIRSLYDGLFFSFSISAVSIALLFLLLFVFVIVDRSLPVFWQQSITISIKEWVMEEDYDYDKDGNATQTQNPNIEDTLVIALNKVAPPSAQQLEYELLDLLSEGIKYQIYEEMQKTGSLPTPLSLDAHLSFQAQLVSDANSQLSTELQEVVAYWHQNDLIETSFNTDFFLNVDSQIPERAGILGGLIGSIIMLTISFLISFPFGVGAAVYFSELMPKNKLNSWLVINTNNLAAVPSILYGVLGLTIFINYFGIPRASPIVGGLVLSLMIIPVIIVTGMTALDAIPKHIEQAAYGLGANKIQMILHHKLPLAMPGMLTGSIIGVARALGETSPLLMIGMLAYISTLPQSLTDSITALPVLIFLWSDHPEQLFAHKAAACIIILLILLFILNSLAIYLRRKFTVRF